MHQLSELDRRGRTVAAAIATLLVLVPLVAAVVNLGRWEPQADDALIDLRARDVGTARNPLVGQPSTSGTYGDKNDNVAHPGPLGFVVLAPATRLLGSVPGTLLSAAAVNAAALVAVAWLLFRHLGPRGGAAGAVLGALAAFSAGAGGLTDPLSSNFGRLPLLAAAVGVWALFCGDVRVAPLTAAFWSFAAQQHLSVLPAAAVLAAAAAVALAIAVWQAPPIERMRRTAWVVLALGVGLALWAPVLIQQVSDDPGNLSALAGYSGDGERQDLGARSAVSQVATVLGPRPFLGRSSPEGWDLVAHRSTAGVLVTFGVVGAVFAAGAWWQRRDRKLLAAVALVAVLVVAGLVTGTNIPDSPEQGRLNFYHWAFALSFFELLVIGWLIARLAPVVLPKLTHGRAVTALVAAAVVVSAVAVTPLVVDRDSDELLQPIDTEAMRELLDTLSASPALADAEGPLVVVVAGDDRFIQIGDTVGSRLDIDGYPVVFPPNSDGFVHPSRVIDRCEVEGAVVVTLVGRPTPADAAAGGDNDPPPGTLIADVDAAPGVDLEAFVRLAAQTAGQQVVLGPDLEAALTALPARQGNLVGSTIVFRLASSPERILLVRSNLDLFIDHPPTAPAMDRDDLIALRDSLPDTTRVAVTPRITAHLLDRAELAAYRPALVRDC